MWAVVFFGFGGFGCRVLQFRVARLHVFPGRVAADRMQKGLGVKHIRLI